MGTGTAYVRAVWLRNAPTCSCGWTGKPRVFHGHAVLDALTHCSDTGHVMVGAEAVSAEVEPSADKTQQHNAN